MATSQPSRPGSSPAALSETPAGRRPTFLVVGVPKAGTTTLYHYLREHPEVFMSPAKEPTYFVPRKSRVATWEAYLALFADAGDAKAIGEATPRYFHDPEAMERIAQALPDVQVVVLLRQPVERALSHYLMLTNNRTALTPEPFSAFFRRHLAEAPGWEHGTPSERPRSERSIAMSFYASALERWFERFGRDRVAVFLQDDLRASPERMMAELYGFLGVDPTFLPDVSRRYNLGQGLPRSGGVQRLVFRQSPAKRLAQRVVPEVARRAVSRILLRLNQSNRQQLSPAERRTFTAVYRNDIQRLERLLDRDLSAWLA